MTISSMDIRKITGWNLWSRNIESVLLAFISPKCFWKLPLSLKFLVTAKTQDPHTNLNQVCVLTWDSSQHLLPTSTFSRSNEYVQSSDAQTRPLAPSPLLCLQIFLRFFFFYNELRAENQETISLIPANHLAGDLEPKCPLWGII